jgi:hypothetical protein
LLIIKEKPEISSSSPTCIAPDEEVCVGEIVVKVEKKNRECPELSKGLPWRHTLS